MGMGCEYPPDIIVFIVFMYIYISISFTILYLSLLGSCQGPRPHTQVGKKRRYAPFSDKNDGGIWMDPKASKSYAYATKTIE